MEYLNVGALEAGWTSKLVYIGSYCCRCSVVIIDGGDIHAIPGSVERKILVPVR